MKCDPAVIEALNKNITAELTAINQYYVHYKMCENWGYKKLAHEKREESLDEMKDADSIIERILYLDGVPNMQRLDPVCVGEDPKEQHELDLAMEKKNVQLYNDSVALARDKGDNGTRHLLEDKLRGEEAAIDHLEAQLGIIEQIGLENYLAEMIHD